MWKQEGGRVGARQAPDLRKELDDEVDEPVVVALLDVVHVEVVELVKVEAGGRLGAPIQAEPLDGLLSGEDLIVAMCPREPGQVVTHRLGEVPHGLILLAPNRPMALRELLSVGAVDQGDVSKLWRRPSCSLVDGKLPRSVGDVVASTDHVGNFHVMVVDHHREEVGWAAVGTEDDEVVDVLVGHRDGILNLVVPGSATLRIRLDAHNGIDALWRHKVVRKLPARSRVPKGELVLLGFGAKAVKSLFRTVAFVRLFLGNQVRRHLLMPRLVLALPNNIPVVLDPEPLHSLADRSDCFLIVPLGIRVLDTQLELSTKVLGIQEAEEGCACTANVQIPRWTRREASYDRGGHPWRVTRGVRECVAKENVTSVDHIFDHFVILFCSAHLCISPETGHGLGRGCPTDRVVTAAEFHDGDLWNSPFLAYM